MAPITRLTSGRPVQVSGASATTSEIVPGPEINGTPIGTIASAGASVDRLMAMAG